MIDADNCPAVINVPKRNMFWIFMDALQNCLIPGRCGGFRYVSRKKYHQELVLAFSVATLSVTYRSGPISESTARALHLFTWFKTLVQEKETRAANGPDFL